MTWPAVSDPYEHRVDPACEVVLTKDGAKVGLDPEQGHYIQVVPYENYLPSIPTYIKPGQTSCNLQLDPLRSMTVCCVDTIGNPIYNATVCAVYGKREASNVSPDKLSYGRWARTSELSRNLRIKLDMNETNSSGEAKLKLPNPSLSTAERVALWVSIQDKWHRFALSSLAYSDNTLTMIVN